MRRDDGGFTLIELIVTIAVLGIFTGIVTLVMSNGSMSYRNTWGNARVQMEIQEALDQIQNILMEANRSIIYGTGEEAALSLIDNDIDGEAGTQKKSLIICKVVNQTDMTEDYVWDILTWDPESQEVSYSSRIKNDVPRQEGEAAPGGGGASMKDAQEKTAPTVLADDITGFWADISQSKEQVIRFQIEANISGKIIKTVHTVNLRNKLDAQVLDEERREHP